MNGFDVARLVAAVVAVILIGVVCWRLERPHVHDGGPDDEGEYEDSEDEDDDNNPRDEESWRRWRRNGS